MNRYNAPEFTLNYDEMDILAVYGSVYSFILISSIIFFVYNRMKKPMIENRLNLNDQMKIAEVNTEYNVVIGQETPFIVRLRGRNFKLIKEIKDYDKIMQVLSCELMREFHAHTAVVFDDEIILIFPDSYKQFKGNCRKLQSIISSYAASSLTLETNILCSFYCTIVECDELIDYIKWRSHRAKSIQKEFNFIKKNLNFEYVKFNLKSKYTEEYNELFLSTILNTNIKLKNLTVIG